MSWLPDASRVTPPDREARFRMAYDALYVSVRRYVTRFLGARDLADDVTQETFAKLWREIMAGRTPESERAWVFRAATNTAINASKARQRRTRLNLAAHEEHQRLRVPVDVERAAARRDLVRRALSRVPDPMRQCLLLYHEGLTGKEIAEILSVSASYVGTLVARAHDRFRRELAALGGTDDLLR